MERTGLTTLSSADVKEGCWEGLRDESPGGPRAARGQD